MESSFTVYYDFEYEGFEDKYWSFDIPMDIFVSGIREYFMKRNVVLDGKDSDVWNSFHDLGSSLDDVFDEMEEWYENKCEQLAYDKFKEYAESEMEYKKKWSDDQDDVEEGLDDGYLISSDAFVEFAKKQKAKYPEMPKEELWSKIRDDNDIFRPVFSAEEIAQHRDELFSLYED